MGKEKDHHTIFELQPELLNAFKSVFINRTDCYPIQLDKGSYVTLKKPLAPEMITAHLKGVVTIGAYALDNNDQAKWLCLDADTDEQFKTLVDVAIKLEQAAITSYLEQSRRGGHLWLFTPPTQGKDIRRFGKQLLSEYQAEKGIELYPKQDRLTTGTGSLVRLPFGVHRKSGRRYYFTTPEGEPLAPTIREQIAILAHPNYIPQAFIDQTLALAPEPKPVSPTPKFERQRKGGGETLSEVLKSTIDVQQFVSRFVQIDEHGKGLCPFHDDQHHSFQINVAGNYWHCYAGCGGGSIIDFWMKWRQIKLGQDGSFTASVTELREMLL